MAEYVSIQFGKRIRLEREKQGLSQERLGELSGMHRTYIGMLERAEKSATLPTIAKLSEALKVRIRDLVDFK